jgi:hypothetical protein
MWYERALTFERTARQSGHKELLLTALPEMKNELITIQGSSINDVKQYLMIFDTPYPHRHAFCY